MKGAGGLVSGVLVTLLLGLCLQLMPAGGVKIISYENFHNDTRIDWDDTARLGAPFGVDLFYWFGEDNQEWETYDLMNEQGGVPVTGPGSLWPVRGSPVPSIIAVSDGPLQVSLPEAQAAATAGWTNPDEEKEVTEQAEALKRRANSPGLRRPKSQQTAGSRPKPAVVYIVYLSSTDEEIQFPAFAQEFVGDIVSRIVRRNPRAAAYRMALANGGVLGMPIDKDGVPLDSSLASLGFGDSSQMTIVGTSPHESSWPQYEIIKHSLEAFLADRPWPPCGNFAQEEPLNKLTVGLSSPSARSSGPSQDNEPSNIVVVILPDSQRVCYNKHALAEHLETDQHDPVSGLATDRLFQSQVKAALLMELPYMNIYLDDALYAAESQQQAADS